MLQIFDCEINELNAIQIRKNILNHPIESILFSVQLKIQALSNDMPNNLSDCKLLVEFIYNTLFQIRQFFQISLFPLRAHSLQQERKGLLAQNIQIDNIATKLINQYILSKLSPLQNIKEALVQSHYFQQAAQFLYNSQTECLLINFKENERIYEYRYSNQQSRSIYEYVIQNPLGEYVTYTNKTHSFQLNAMDIHLEQSEQIMGQWIQIARHSLPMSLKFILGILSERILKNNHKYWISRIKEDKNNYSLYSLFNYYQIYVDFNNDSNVYMQELAKQYYNALINYVESRVVKEDIQDFGGVFIKVYHKQCHFVRDTFKNNSLFTKALLQAFSYVLDEKLLDRFQQFIDLNMEKIDQIGRILQFQQNSTKFIIKRKRLLQERVLSKFLPELGQEEYGLLNLLQIKYGAPAINQIWMICNDVSKSITSQVGKQVIHMRILNSGEWNIRKLHVKLPQHIVEAQQQVIRERYDYPNRQVIFFDWLGKAEIQFKQCKIVMNCIQYLIMLQFESVNEWTQQQLIMNTGINDIYDDLLQLINAGLLLRMNDKISLNMDYERSVNLLRRQEYFSNEEKVCQEVKSEHQLLEAQIVKEMKKNKQLCYGELIELLQSKDHERIKSIVEDLIEREYLRRHSSNWNVLEYVQ